MFKVHNTVHHNNRESMEAKHLNTNNTHPVTLPHSMAIRKQITNNNLALTYQRDEIYKHLQNHGVTVCVKKDDFSNSTPL